MSGVVRHHPLIAREAWPIVTVVIVLGVLTSVTLGRSPAVPVCFLVALLVYLFRDPPRDIPSLPLAVVSPVDGALLHIEETRDPWLRRDMIRVVVETGIADVYSLRSPTEGKLLQQWRERLGDEHSGSLRQHVYQLRTDEGDDVIFGVSARVAFPKFCCHARVGQRVGQGQRIGYFFFGAQIDVYLPQSSMLNIAEGDRVRAGASTLGSFVHDEDPATKSQAALIS